MESCGFEKNRIIAVFWLNRKDLSLVVKWPFSIMLPNTLNNSLSLSVAKTNTVSGRTKMTIAPQHYVAATGTFKLCFSLPVSHLHNNI